jgi:hypothetical protein
MLTYILLWALFLIVGTIICFKILHSLAKTAAIIGFILILFIAITATLTYSDIQELKSEIAEKEIVILLHEDNTLLFSTVQIGWGNIQQFTAVSMGDDELQSWIKKERYNHIKSSGSYYKVVLIETNIFEPIQNSETLLTVARKQELSYEERATAYATLEEQLMDQEGMLYLVQEYKEGNIIVYPKTMAFRVIEILPKSWVEKLVE